MGFGEILILLAACAVMFFGVIGTFFPSIPGIPIIWLTMLVYAIIEGFQEISWVFLVITLLVALAVQVAEHYARAWGAKRFGAGKAGMWGAVIGSFVGLFFMPIGLLLGPFLGAMIGELIVGRPVAEAARAGWGGLVGVLGSVVINFVVALSMLIAFVIAAL